MLARSDQGKEKCSSIEN